MAPRHLRLLIGALAAVVGVAGCAAGLATDTSKAIRGPVAADGAAPETAAPPSDGAAGADAPLSQVFVRVQYEDVIDDAELQALRAIPGVAEVVARREDDGALWASRRSDGTAVDDLPPDFKISVALEVDRPELPVHPGPGEVVLTEAGRAHRDLDVGSVVELTDRVPRTVVAITDDPQLDDVEFVVSQQDAEALGIRGRQRARLTLVDGADADAVAAAAASLLGPDTIAQPRPRLERPMVLSLPATKARFGEFAFKDLPGRDIQAGASWIEEYVVETEIPVVGTVVCNRLIIDDLTAVMTELQESGLAGEIDPDLYGGCWSPRRINKNANLSRHAWGIAIDLNVDFSAPGLGPIPSDGVIETFERHGFRWGGDYPIPDNHHFEWVGTG